MNRFPFLRFSHARAWGSRLLCVAAILAISLASFIVGPRPVAAQTEYDFNGDGKVTCDDFEEEFPDTFTDEATKALEQYPEELKRLDGKDGTEGVACEGQAADETSDEANSASETPVPTTESEPAAADATEPVDVTAPAEISADVMARVEGCAVVAISSRDVVGAGCPGVGVVSFRIPEDAPSMQGTVLMSPGAAPAAEAEAAEESAADTRASGSNQEDEESTNSSTGRNATTAKKAQKQADDSAKADKDKGSKNKNKDKNSDKKGKKGNKDKKKGGKKSAKKQDKGDEKAKGKDKKNRKGKGKKGKK